MKQWAILVCMLIAAAAQAQEFGGNPASQRWSQVNTDTVRVIFPRGLDLQAKRVASIVHTLQRNYAHSIGDQLRKIDIVLHNQTAISNAYVQLAPYRSEFYLTPPQDPFELGAFDWTANLAVHEFRHVQQYSNFNKGFSRVASILLGQQGQALANAAAIPDWFFEGDAVFNETRLTPQGRGRLPLFMNSFRTLFESGKHYNYEQLRNGSLRKYIPGHYELGYLLVAYGREKYGDDIWRKVTDDAARFKPFFYPMQGAVKKHMGIPYTQFVNDAMKFYQSQWSAGKQEQLTSITPTEKNNVADYRYPYVAEDGSVIVLKKSYRKIPAFYRVSPGSEKKIATRGIAVDDHFSYNNGKIIYAAYQPDARWGYREFTSLRLIDVNSGEQQTVVSHSRYFSPDIAHNGQSILAVELDDSLRSNLVQLSLNGEVLRKFNGDGSVYSSPKFSADDKSAFVVQRNGQGEMALLKYSLSGPGVSVFELGSIANRPIGFLTVKGDTVCYTVSYKGRDEIWALVDRAPDYPRFRVASYATGLYQAALKSDGSLVASAFTADGYRLAAVQPLWEKDSGSAGLAALYVPHAFNPADRSVIAQQETRDFPVTRYPKTKGLFNFHSYEPSFVDPEYSLTLHGQNVLNTLESELSYTYNRNEQSHKAGYNAVYGGSYVQPVLGVSQTWHRSGRLNADTLVNWNELVGYAGLQLPLNLSGGNNYRFLTLSALYNIEQVSWTGTASKLFRNKRVDYLTSRLSYVSQVQKAAQQIYPHWAHALLLQYRNAVNGTNAHQFLGSVGLYFPGLANSHSFVVTAAYHARDTLNQYLFSNNFPFARGYSAVDFPRMWRIGFNYHLPLAYPDWGFGNILYFQRVRANLFYDYSRARSLRTGVDHPFNTVGVEAYFDTKWWNQQPITLGIRYSRLLNNEFQRGTQPDVWELILPVSL